MGSHCLYVYGFRIYFTPLSVVDVEFQLRGKRWVGRDGRVQHALRVGCATGFDAAAGGE
jgi:hypothetical protein